MLLGKKMYLETFLVSRKQNLLLQQCLRNSVSAAMIPRLPGPAGQLLGRKLSLRGPGITNQSLHCRIRALTRPLVFISFIQKTTYHLR